MSNGLEAPLVVASSLCRHFLTGTERLEVLRNLDLEVLPGETVAITGESGCGKSTLLGLVGGLDRPSAGFLSVGGIDVAGLGESELSAFRNRQVGFIFQFHFLLKDFTALENVLIPGMVGGEPRRTLEERGRRLLTEVGLQQRMDAWPLELSGGNASEWPWRARSSMSRRFSSPTSPRGTSTSATPAAWRKCCSDWWRGTVGR